MLCIPSNANGRALHQLLLETFPPLSLCGGYGLLRCTGKTKLLEVIDPPSGGHTPMSWFSTVAQSRVYIRPLQQDIPLQAEVTTEVEVSSYYFMHVQRVYFL